MRRIVLAVLLMFSVMHQSMAGVGQGLVGLAGEGLAHAVLHWDKEGHHHHDDGSFHLDDSDESSKHLQADSNLNAAALPSVSTFPLAPVTPLASFVAVHSQVPAPALDGLTRPPCLRA